MGGILLGTVGSGDKLSRTIYASYQQFRGGAIEWSDIAERAFLKRLEGGCQVPIACHGTVAGEVLTLTGFVSDCEGVQCLKKTMTGMSFLTSGTRCTWIEGGWTLTIDIS